MNVLYIRSHKRYAVRLAVEVEREDGARAEALAIELSARGCRLSHLEDFELEQDEAIRLMLPNEIVLHGRVRWAHDGLAGIGIDCVLATSSLRDLILQGRQGGDAAAGAGHSRYGT